MILQQEEPADRVDPSAEPNPEGLPADDSGDMRTLREEEDSDDDEDGGRVMVVPPGPKGSKMLVKEGFFLSGYPDIPTLVDSGAHATIVRRDVANLIHLRHGARKLFYKKDKAGLSSRVKKKSVVESRLGLPFTTVGGQTLTLTERMLRVRIKNKGNTVITTVWICENDQLSVPMILGEYEMDALGYRVLDPSGENLLARNACATSAPTAMPREMGVATTPGSESAAFEFAPAARFDSKSRADHSSQECGEPSLCEAQYASEQNSALNLAHQFIVEKGALEGGSLQFCSSNWGINIVRLMSDSPTPGNDESPATPSPDDRLRIVTEDEMEDGRMDTDKEKEETPGVRIW